MGSSVFVFSMGLMLLRQTGSAANFAFSQMLGPLMALLLVPFIGSLVDKLDFKALGIISQIASIFGLALFWLGLDYRVLPVLVMVYPLLMVLTISDAFLETTYTSAIISMVAEEEVQKVMAIRQMITSLTLVMTPVLGAVLYQFLSLKGLLLFEITMEALCLLLIFFIRFYLFKAKRPLVSGQSDMAGGWQEIFRLFKEGLAYIKGNRVLTFTIIYGLVINVLFASINVGLPVLEIRVFHFTDTEYGLAQMFLALGVLSSSLFLAGKKDFKKPIFVAWTLGIFLFLVLLCLGGLFYLNLPHYLTLAGIFLILILAGGLLGAINIPIQVRATKTIPQSVQGRVFNLNATLLQVFVPLGLVFFGLVFDSGLGPDMIFAGAGIVGMVLTLILPLFLQIPFREI